MMAQPAKTILFGGYLDGPKLGTDHVFGFVAGRSHVDAARVHVNARWVLSVDIRDFFQSTPQHRVVDALQGIGFPDEGAELIATLACLRGFLAQGAPTSPVISNICFSELDDFLSQIANDYDVKLSRYADDIVFSGENEYPSELHSRITALFEGGPWQLASQKTSIAIAPKRLKVHGLLVSGSEVRLTKGYRNRLRAYDHLTKKKGHVKPEDLAKMQGHLAYGDFVAKLSSSGVAARDFR
ncbi:reverse transcriptase family protein [Dyella sedimenti]|uniref:reverse transcriptase family protein n=1 Tax=Dyella sedimenti TaxID=2919947 RepID=UPI001FAA6F5F|nr:reverse transcriptase family protein [Dyella sedimenti]